MGNTLTLSALLTYYKRKDIQKAMVAHAKDKEIAIKFGEKGFGKRPDTLQYENDILELAKQGATSFHSSEELWKSPQQLNPLMKRKDTDNLRKGWDLVLDIDCPHWMLSKLITWLIVKTLKEEGISDLSVKFSGNKGFHIGVPFESFPARFEGNNTSLLFPEYARKIASYILDKISLRHIVITSDNKVEFGKKYPLSVKELIQVAPKPDELFTNLCTKCSKPKKDEGAKTEFVCSKCETRIFSEEDEDYRTCPKCKSIMEKMGKSAVKCICGSESFEKRFNPFSIIEVDTILISSRHLYRMPYSLHEKSGLASVPIDPEKILDFEKKQADPANLVVSNFVFLDRKNAAGGAKRLLMEARDWKAEQNIIDSLEEKRSAKKYSDFEALQEAIPEDFFPPCIKKGLKGIDDGKKRFMFLLVNFLSSVGWDHDGINKLLKEWNKKNKEQLREVLIVGQLRYHQQQKKRILPPNCQNSMYYKDMQICSPDNLCQKIKNPVNYSKRKTFYLNKDGKGNKKGKEAAKKEPVKGTITKETEKQ
ncbi:hypothetical protein ACFL6I_25725 [candidate division KSB1 bacterium]